jgi:alpha-L-fucosidase 2
MAAHIPTFSMRTPFQIDGNFGCTAVLPKCWCKATTVPFTCYPFARRMEDRAINGLACSGWFRSSFSWSDGKVQRVEIKSNLGGNCRIRVPNALLTAKGAVLDVAKLPIQTRSTKFRG